MSKKIRCAVLGLGRLGYWHAENLSRRVKGADLTAVADPLEGRAEQVARELGVPKWFQNPDDVFEDPDIDAVAIVTPTTTHAEMIKKAAASRKHIFVEKPITHTVEEADEVIKAIRDHQVYCQVGFMRRFDPSYVEAKRRIDAGDIGKPIYFKGVTRDGIAPPPNFIQHSGGLFLDFSIHDYDAARFLLGAEVTSVTALGSVVHKQYVAEFNDVDQALTYLTFDSGAAADIEASRNANYGYDIRAEIIGTEGAIQIGNLQHHNLKVLTKKGCTHDIVPDFPSLFMDAYLLEMISFIDCLKNDQKPLVDEYDGKIALEIAVAATKSYREKTTIQLESVHSVSN
ncbi:inositol 2-dehydrogenase [Lihuaxuella thermophila]|uniref:Scyllo-inositol 2-dehydrogenase (NAD+) n=1 Tax=Lihuaxuella thermophila TaxID=1173111 RepID=A0A1H8EL00_9BACL|nr:inositol 2-dehydrogenase [Lihuaxuella thermophila]SEN20153.1 scyllo-inositol 2-dehydrogenase (NAD+) [Lihuaxuella thermophila]